MEKIIAKFNEMFNEIVDNKKYKAGCSSDIEIKENAAEHTRIYVQSFFFKADDGEYTYTATVNVDLEGNIIDYEYKLD